MLIFNNHEGLPKEIGNLIKGLRTSRRPRNHRVESKEICLFDVKTTRSNLATGPGLRLALDDNPMWKDKLRRVGLGDDHIGGLLTGHVDAENNVVARDLGEDGGVHNSQAINAADLEVGVKNSVRVIIRANGGSAGGVVAPSLILGELLEVSLGRDVLGRPDALERAVERDEVLESLDAVLHALVDSLEILLTAEALEEAAEGDVGGVTGVDAGQVDGASVVAAVGLESEPGPDAEIGEGVLGVVGEITVEVSRDTAEEQVRVGIGDGRVLEVAESNAVGGVAALETADAVLPVGEARVLAVVGAVHVQESAILEEGKVGGSLANDADLVTVLHVAADTRKILDHRDVERLELGSRADTAELEELRGVEDTGRDNDLLAGKDAARNTAILFGRAGIGAVQALSVEVLDAGGLGLVTRLIEVDLGDQGVQGQVQLVLLGAVCVLRGVHIVNEVARRRAGEGRVLHGERNLVDVVVLVTAGGIVVHIDNQNLKKTGDSSDDLAQDVLSHGGGSGKDERQNLGVLDNENRRGCLGLEPSIVTVNRRVEAYN